MLPAGRALCLASFYVIVCIPMRQYIQTATVENTIHILKQAIEKYGCPREAPTDRGSQFYANEDELREKGMSQFEAYLAEQDIKHILCRVDHPQTNGKLERFYGVYEQKQHQFNSVDEYAHWHNEIKPHLSLNIETLEPQSKPSTRNYHCRRQKPPNRFRM